MAKRAALPIAVTHDGTAFGIATHDGIWFPPTVWGAHFVYRNLVASLETDPGISSRVPGAAVDPAPSSPGDVL
jgi:hypothetical protein